MSVCADDCTGYCGGCAGRQPQVDIPEVVDTEELEGMLAQLKDLRIEARRLTKSGNPAVKAEGRAAVAHCDDQIRWIQVQLAKEG